MSSRPRLDYDEIYENVPWTPECWVDGCQAVMLVLLRNMMKIELMNVIKSQVISTTRLGCIYYAPLSMSRVLFTHQHRFNPIQMSFNVLYIWGRYDEAFKNYENVLEYFQRTSNLEYQAIVLHDMCTIYHDKEQYDKALELYEKSLAISEKLMDQSGLAKTLNNMAMVYQARSYYDKALELYEKSLAISEKLMDQSGLMRIRNSTGLIQFDTR